MKSARLSVVLFLLSTASFALGDAPVTQPANYAAAEQVIRDPHSSDADAINAILAIRKLPFRPASAKLWSDVANSDAFSTDRRRWAIMQLFDRNVLPGMTLAKIGELLNKPTWLRLDGMRMRDNSMGGTGWVPLDNHDDEMVVWFNIGIGLPNPGEIQAVFSIVGRSDDQLQSTEPKDIFSALMSQPSSLADLHVHQVRVYIDDDPPRRIEDALIRHEFVPIDHSPDAAVETLAGITREGASGLATVWELSPKDPRGIPDDHNLNAAYSGASGPFDRLVSTIQMYVGAQILQPDKDFSEESKEFGNAAAELTRQVDHLQGKVVDPKAGIDSDLESQIRAATLKIVETSRHMSEDDREVYERSLDQLKWPSFENPTVTN